ncbi:hypothetical protein DOTSEDRAFT_64462 [Dothistroma septosporum NZE10]|uniref:Uncharacterized protein n=1 Tax=Dothistroma septosporum (strain NZE10 / CBS 128990) TaxID=675120 RepID=N1PKU0_DOTSN|nr:hypothetical protein DOTSEDRAFT_64462 [Dothistroma septosporum NZE10]
MLLLYIIMSSSTLPTTVLPTTVRPSSGEINTVLLAPGNLVTGVQSLHLDRLVVVSSAIPHEHLDKLDSKSIERQPIHADTDCTHQAHPFALVVNVPLITFTSDNGSTELWLGTNMSDLFDLHVQDGEDGDRASSRMKQHLLKKRRPIAQNASVVIRGLRLWHAGRPNLTQEIIVMLAMISEREAAQRYLHRGFGKSYDFGQTS